MIDESVNKCQVKAYYRGSLSIVPGADYYLSLAQNLRFSTLFPGGLYGTCSFTVPITKINDIVPLQGGQRIVVYNSTTTVWEGYITGIVRAASASSQALEITCLGAWGDILMRQGIDKPWLDDRIDAQTWPEATAAYDANDITLLANMSVDRNSRIRFTPKAVAFANNAYHRVTCTAPTGQTIKRITCSYDMAEAAQAWELLCFDSAGASLFSVTATGTGTQDVTLGTPRQIISIAFKSRAAQTPASDGTIYGQVTALKVYTETGNIDAKEIATDVVGYCTDLNSDTTGVGAITRAISPFITAGYKTFAEILTNAVGYGDASGNRWYAQLTASDTAPTPNGEPRLVLAQYPSLTDGTYDCAISAADVFAQGIGIELDYTRLVNDVIITYTDTLGKKVTYTSADNAALKSTTSITKYGTRQAVVDIGNSDATGAVNYGARYIAAFANPVWRMSSPVRVIGYIGGRGGQIIPASEIKAGTRLLIRDFVAEPTGDLANGTPLVMMITKVDYTDAGGGSASVTAGPLDVILTS